ncbi:AMP-binding protein [Nocardioides sp. HDW12B]|uniref:AMP-dependent synthetase/ligase n=1 Tax=Nocardioides sp. HDW12B TaxID=2714939 RepID=UPI001409C874|nr:AMP-dependent synthetase/ligase [Nocardioides sp. HDW12B]QIK66083.1 AMP-binding protein [Nocardioides sp. HDW12B]
MREYAAPPIPQASPWSRLTDPVVAHAEQQPEAPQFALRVASGDEDGPRWEDVDNAAFRTRVEEVARGLLAAGLRVADRVALLARTRLEWTVVDYAIWWVGGVSVPVYATSSDEQVAWILSDSGCRFAVVEDASYAARVAGMRASAPDLEQVWVIDEAGASDASTLRDLVERGEDVGVDDLEHRRTAVGRDDVATLIYTSGTTGQPKGCVLTHANFLDGCEATATELDELFGAEGAATLLVLPLAHVFARIIQVGAVNRGVRLGHAPDPRRFLADVATFRPTFVLGVPRVFENAFTQLSQEAAASGRARGFERAVEVAIAHSRSEGRPGRVLGARHSYYDRTVYRRIREALGGACAFGISGGAPLGDRLSHFFRGAGVPILEGYGLTETTGASTVNTPDNHRVGTVGRPLPGTAARIDENGELLLRGPHVMRGYWSHGDVEPVTDDRGWLATGDLAEIDAEGFVRVTGRAKEMIVTAGGKNVSPGHLEERIRSGALVSQCLVVGDGQPFVGALITLDPDAYGAWAKSRGKGPLRSHTQDADLRAEIQKVVDKANATVSQAESIRRFEILAADWTEDSGALTASRKLRRNVVVREFRREIRELFQ